MWNLKRNPNSQKKGSYNMVTRGGELGERWSKDTNFQLQEE